VQQRALAQTTLTADGNKISATQFQCDTLKEPAFWGVGLPFANALQD
jgi:hypothetical protein